MCQSVGRLGRRTTGCAAPRCRGGERLPSLRLDACTHRRAAGRLCSRDPRAVSAGGSGSAAAHPARRARAPARRLAGAGGSSRGQSTHRHPPRASRRRPARAATSIAHPLRRRSTRGVARGTQRRLVVRRGRHDPRSPRRGLGDRNWCRSPHRAATAPCVGSGSRTRHARRVVGKPIRQQLPELPRMRE